MILYESFLSSLSGGSVSGGALLVIFFLSGGVMIDSRGHSIKGDEDCFEEEVFCSLLLWVLSRSVSKVPYGGAGLVISLGVFLMEMSLGCFLFPGVCFCIHVSVLMSLSAPVCLSGLMSSVFMQPMVVSGTLVCPGVPSVLSGVMFFFEWFSNLIRFVTMGLRFSVNVMIGHVLVEKVVLLVMGASEAVFFMAWEMFSSVSVELLFTLEEWHTELLAPLVNSMVLPEFFLLLYLVMVKMGIIYSVLMGITLLFYWCSLGLWGCASALCSVEMLYTSFQVGLFCGLFNLYLEEHGGVDRGSLKLLVEGSTLSIFVRG